VSIDPQAPPKPALSDRLAAIENEIPAYRAIYPLAVASVIFGVLGSLVFVNIWFTALGLLAIAAGLYSDLKIRKDPDIFTGRALAQTGIALGMIFTLSAWTVTTVMEAKLKKGASDFAKQYVKVLKKGNLADAIWYRVPPDIRRESAPEDLLKKMSEGTRDPMSFDTHVGQTKNVIQRLTGPGGDIHFDRIETYGFDNLTEVAQARLELHGQKDKSHPDVEYVMLVLKKDNAGGKVAGWYVGELYYPYKPNSAEIKTSKPVDDGHGHGH
jgi:hypothetical protein